ncbi:MAG TPA: dTDP-4-dehydrorhamnose reductase [Acidimicrobiales bacterium]|jgi:dTDP-4-dehydrorhamnose reductase|nr:dTDP-4-dehydrorhamnose reductase [Acidimicrobiales bacterium]
MRVLVTGASGQVGTDLVRWFAGATSYEVVAADHGRLDVGDRDAVRAAAAGVAPSIIVHAAAWTAVDDCEADPDRAWRVNALGTRHVAEAAASVGAHLVYLSTDYVFDGTLERPYHEWDAPNPRSVYGASKLAGEREVMVLAPGAAIVRTSWVCGVHGDNMVKTVLRVAAKEKDLAFVDDQRGCPTFADDLARAVVELAVGRRPGTFHVTNQGATTWYQFARDVVSAAGRDPAMVHPITTAELSPPRLAPRPANSVLDNAALRGSDLPLLPDHRDALVRTVRTLMGAKQGARP